MYTHPCQLLITSTFSSYQQLVTLVWFIRPNIVSQTMTMGWGKCAGRVQGSKELHRWRYPAQGGVERVLSLWFQLFAYWSHLRDKGRIRLWYHGCKRDFWKKRPKFAVFYMHSCFVEKYRMRAVQWENDFNTFFCKQ